MTDTQTLRHLITALYEATLDPSRLPIFLRELTALVGADAGILAAASPEDDLPSTVITHGLTGTPAKTPEPFHPPEHVNDPVAWRAALNDPGISDVLTLEVAADSTAKDGGFLTLLRRIGTFHDTLHDDLTIFRPHLPHALRLLRQVEAAHEARRQARALVDSIGHGMALMSSDGRLIIANEALERLIHTNGSLTLTADRCLRLSDPAAQEALTQLLEDITHGHRRSGALAVPRLDGQRPLGIVVSAMQDGPATGRALTVHVSALEAAPLPPLEVLRGLFDLTPAEAHLLQALMSDQRIEDVAANRGVSITTVRTQLAHLFRKTGTNRQPELVRLAINAASVLNYGP